MKVGSSTGGIETSNRYRRKKARQRRAEEAEWKSKNGPVTIIKVAGYEVYLKGEDEKKADAEKRAEKRAVRRSGHSDLASDSPASS